MGRVVRDHCGLTLRQGEALAVILSSVLDRGRPPTYRELADALGMACHTGAVSHLRALHAMGWIEWAEGAHDPRGITIRGARWRAAGGGRLRLVLTPHACGWRLADWLSGRIALPEKETALVA